MAKGEYALEPPIVSWGRARSLGNHKRRLTVLATVHYCL